MKKIYNVLALLAFPSLLLLYSYSGGSPGGKTGSMGDGGNTCTDCHAGTAISQTDWITSDIPAEGFVAGETYTITAKGTHSGVVKFGFELTAEDDMGNKIGTLTITDAARTKLANANHSVTHTSGGTTPLDNSATWSANWTAPDPAPETVYFNAAFNAANGNGGTSGDVIYTTEVTYNQFHVGVAEDLFAESIKLYPNPATSKSTLLAEEGTSFSVVDVNGRVIENGYFFNTEVSLNLSNYERGIYFVQFTKDNLRTAKTLILN